MPIFEYTCLDCGNTSEILVARQDEIPECRSCRSTNLKKNISAHSSLSGKQLFGPASPCDSGCCNTPTPGCPGPNTCGNM
ncbi:MAG: zinc ribbon domain-containing protein [Deltaproteobacteria bacterium]|nr:zinc ribbon domain-containing protein [Deltaproteobacteria bacterium]MBW1914559.1 zinc ribbon domain-containing protein [Deltaproteobacteria bacterium]